MIDWDFIALLEGGRCLVGYVPDPGKSQSGVTIATGVDLGARSVEDLKDLGFSRRLVEILAPYCHVKGRAAVDLLDRRPLVISAPDAVALDRRIKEKALERLVSAYDRATGVSFGTLPPGIRTVIGSVAFQYGDLASECPKFWAAACGRDWSAMRAELMDFGDRYPGRRHFEAVFLWGSLSERI